MARRKQAPTYADPERDERVTLPVDAETAVLALLATPPVADEKPQRETKSRRQPRH
jgi:hypothetical protein